MPRKNSLRIPIIGLLVFVSLLFLSASNSFAFLYRLEVLDQEAIAKLSDEDLVDTYIEVKIELEVSTIFHQTSGFTPRDYEKHKSFLRYRVYLIREMKKRNLEIPRIK